MSGLSRRVLHRLRPRAVLANLALLVASILVVLVAGEVTLRLFPNLMTEGTLLRIHWQRSGDPRVVVVRDPYIGFLYRPNEEGEQGRAESRFRYALDEHGFRNPTPWPESADVVVLGDSWTFGYGVGDNDGWVARLADRFPSSRVINLGLIGSAPEQSTRILERFGTPLQPKLVIYGLFPGNDINDTRTFHRWLDEGGPGNYAEWRYNTHNIGGWRGALYRRSYLMVLADDLIKSWHVGFSGKTIELPNEGRLRLVPNGIAREASRAKPDDPDFRHAVDAVVRAQELAGSVGADFVVVLYPTKEEVYLPMLGASAPDVVGPFVTELEARGVPYIDLRSIMQEHARAGERLYFEIDGHANHEGYRLIADTVATWVGSGAEAASASDAGSFEAAAAK